MVMLKLIQQVGLLMPMQQVLLLLMVLADQLQQHLQDNQELFCAVINHLRLQKMAVIDKVKVLVMTLVLKLRILARN